MTKKEEAEAKRAAKLEAERERIRQMQQFECEIGEQMHPGLSATERPQVLICGIDEAGRGPFAGPVVAGAVILDLQDPAKEILYLNDSKKLSEKRREQLYREILEKAVAVGIGYSGARIIDSINILQATYRAMRMAITNLRHVSHLVTGTVPGSLDMDDHAADAYEPEVHELVRRLICYELPASVSSGNEQQADLCTEHIQGEGTPLPSVSGEEHIQEEDGRMTSDSRKGITPDYILADAVHIPEIRIPQKGIIKGDAKSVSIAAGSIIAKVTRDHIMYEYDKQYPEYGFASHKGYGTAAHIAAIKEHGMLDIHRRSFIHFT